VNEAVAGGRLSDGGTYSRGSSIQANIVNASDC
jgi:hypothetical protein